jgi:hypothetical protein
LIVIRYFAGFGVRFTKKWQWDLKNEVNALKSFCGSVEMTAPMMSMASSGCMISISGLDSDHINRAAAYVPVTKALRILENECE